MRMRALNRSARWVTFPRREAQWRVPEVFRAGRKPAGGAQASCTPPPSRMLPLAARQPAKCIPELCTRHTSPGSPRNPSPERERAGGSAAAAEVSDIRAASPPSAAGCSL